MSEKSVTLRQKALGMKDKLLGDVVGFVNDNEYRPIYQMAKDIKVKIIDWKPIVEKLKASHESLKDLNLDIRSGNGIIFIGENKQPVLIDSECCGVDSETKNLMIGDKFMTVEFIEGIGVFKKEEGFIAMMPMFYVDFDYDDIEKCFTGEEKELWEFMGGRYEYNPRIHNNLRGIVELYKGIDKKKK
jgi:hypothetical protein